MESARECLVVLDRKLDIAKANPNFYDLFMLSPEDAIGKKFTSIMHVPDQDTRFTKLLYDAFNNTRPFRDLQLKLSLPYERCDEASISANKIALVGIKDDYLLVKIRCSHTKINAEY
jgi:PAS domain-containing protein